MLNVWKKSLKALLILNIGQCFALPDIPSFNDCPDVILNSGFQNDSDASLGSGGEYPGLVTRSVIVENQNREYFLYIPSRYSPDTVLPLLFTWHGASGVDQTINNAKGMRTFWQNFAEQNQLIIVAQAATGATGGGFLFPNDITIFYAILDDLKSHYNIENKRVYGHGFSSGGHLMHTLMLYYNQGLTAYSVSAGAFFDAVHEDVNVPQNRPVIPVFVSIGENDPLFNRIQIERNLFLNAGWEEGKTYWIDSFNGGHELDLNLHNKIWDKLCTLSR